MLVRKLFIFIKSQTWDKIIYSSGHIGPPSTILGHLVSPVFCSKSCRNFRIVDSRSSLSSYAMFSSSNEDAADEDEDSDKVLWRTVPPTSLPSWRKLSGSNRALFMCDLTR